MYVQWNCLKELDLRLFPKACYICLNFNIRRSWEKCVHVHILCTSFTVHCCNSIRFIYVAVPCYAGWANHIALLMVAVTSIVSDSIGHRWTYLPHLCAFNHWSQPVYLLSSKWQCLSNRGHVCVCGHSRLCIRMLRGCVRSGLVLGLSVDTFAQAWVPL